MDLAGITGEQWAGVVARAKESMARIQGPLDPETQARFDAEWAPRFAFPSEPVLRYFEQLVPLVEEFAMVQAACVQAASAADHAQFQLAVAHGSDDPESVVSLSYQAKHRAALLSTLSRRLSELAGAVTALGPVPDASALAKRARARHEEAFALFAPPVSTSLLEGVWEGEEIGTWELQILRDLGRGLWLADLNENRIVLETLPLPGTWLALLGRPEDGPEEATLYQLARVGDRLRLRSFEPSDREGRGDPGEFETQVGTRTRGIERRLAYRDDWDSDSDGKPVDWAGWLRTVTEAKPLVTMVLRDGGLPREREGARRREWATARADRELGDTIERMAAELDVRTDKVEREKAEGRALMRMLAVQDYDYGNDPPGYANPGDWRTFDESLLLPAERGGPTAAAVRERRREMLVWNLNQRLALKIAQELDYQLDLHGMKEEQREHDRAVLEAAQREREADVARAGERKTELVAEVRDDIAADIAKEQGRQQDDLQALAEQQEATRKRIEAELAKVHAEIARLRGQPESRSRERDLELARFRVESLRRDLAGLPAEFSAMAEDRRRTTDLRVGELRAGEAVPVARIDSVHQERVRALEKEKRILADKQAALAARQVRMANDRGGFDLVSIDSILAKARRRVIDEFDVPAYARGVAARLDAELPSTSGSGSSMGFPDPPGRPGGGPLELPWDRARVEAIPATVTEADRLAAARAASAAEARREAQRAHASAAAAADAARVEAEARARAEKIELFQEEIAALTRSLDGVRRTEAELAADDPDRASKLAGLGRDRLSLEASIAAAKDQIRFVETGTYQRTRTPSDDLNQAMMAEDGRTMAVYWQNVDRKISRMDRLIEAARPEDQLALRRRWNDEVEAAIADGCRFERLDQAARKLGDEVVATHAATGRAADREAARAETAIAVAEGVKTATDYAVFGISLWATAGLASPASMLLPTCAESGLAAGYSIATGYLEGGPEAAVKQAAGSFSQAAGLFQTAMDSYQKGVLDHLEAAARDPQKVKGGETGAGLSAMAWALGLEGLKQGAQELIVTPVLTSVKQSMRPSAKGYFGKEEMRFPTLAERREERRFKDREIMGKHLVEKFRTASRNLANAEGAGKSSRELAPFVEQVEIAYRAANSDFHAKNRMKRMARLDEGLGRTWAEVDSREKGRLVQEVRADLSRQGLSTPPMQGFSNSASRGGVGMDLDLGFVEPPRWVQVPSHQDPAKPMLVPNPEYLAWRRSLTRTDPATGRTTVIAPHEYARIAKTAMDESYRRVYGHSPDEAFLEFTWRDSPEAYKDPAWLGVPCDPSRPWADFANVDPRWAGQAADVTGFKSNRLEKIRGKPDELPSMPKYSALVESARGLLKDFDTKLIGGKADTGAFGNEAGYRITVNPASPLGTATPAVRRYFLELRTVLSDLTNGRITPSEAERRLYAFTGGEGLTGVAERLRVVMAARPATGP